MFGILKRNINTINLLPWLNKPFNFNTVYRTFLERYIYISFVFILKIALGNFIL